MVLTIFGNPKIKFGNVWAFTSMMVLYGQKHELSEVLLSSRCKRCSLIREIWPLFDVGKMTLRIVDKPYTVTKRYGTPEHIEPYAKTHIQWNPNQGKRFNFCYQLEPGKHVRHKEKLLTCDPHKLLDRIDPHSWSAKCTVGLPNTIAQSIYIMTKSDFFIGICSGMSHVAHSVGLPVYLKDWRHLKRSHPGKDYFAFDENSEQSIQDMIYDINSRGYNLCSKGLEK